MKNLCFENPVIAAVHDKNFYIALKSKANVLFFIGADILTVEKYIISAHNGGKKLFVHLDLANGIGKDKAGVAFLAKIGADGIISTKTNIIKFAKEKNIFAVQRIFAPDSQSVNSAYELIKSTKPDFLEVMPGVAYKAVKKLATVKIPVIAGGLIETKEEVQAALDSGAVAVSTGQKELWGI